MQKRIRDFGLEIGSLETGRLNKISDVSGVTAGHATIDDGPLKTGVTAILPHQGNVFINKVVGAVHVLNGFGKSVGTIQLEELGAIETPILLTNTLSIGTCTDSLIDYMLEQNPEIGRTTGTVNPVVGECNDMYLNDIRARAVQSSHVREALTSAVTDFHEGGVGAGTGMKCFGLKGGIGSSSRVISYSHGSYTIGVLTLTNFGSLEQLRVNEKRAGHVIKQRLADHSHEPDKGSVIVVVATDLPVSSRQLKRIIKRAGVGLSRCGSYIGNGSGDVIFGFSTANQVPHHSDGQISRFRAIHEEDIDLAFLAAADATEEAVLNSMITAETVTGRDGNTLYSLRTFMEFL
ncbi:S58 family peptidase [Sediminibacillus dalangtanensis]|uniref:S58 family peptidase n=1 Tax=Sediminibacillus dalangtanensis TaxID=2729421 RepID=A0ABX7VPR4_9BACI|nr:P1 family peptidase [Sediminibacillus dalangtanensis]QTM97944.1 S58 family peptidase [Sediminibacillus dalangtanensis]